MSAWSTDDDVDDAAADDDDDVSPKLVADISIRNGAMMPSLFIYQHRGKEVISIPACLLAYCSVKRKIGEKSD